jgi:hypothetical protein
MHGGPLVTSTIETILPLLRNLASTSLYQMILGIVESNDPRAPLERMERNHAYLVTLMTEENPSWKSEVLKL